jgi:hypothetical protein
MTLALVVLTVANLALATLLVFVSGFVLQGVNNTGPMMPEAIFFVGFIVMCLAAPAIAWALRRRLQPGPVLAIAAAPLALATAVLAIS